MIGLICYLLVACVSVFCFIVGADKAGIKPATMYGDYFSCIVWGFFWPLGWTIYAPYLAAIWYIKNRKENKNG